MSQNNPDQENRQVVDAEIVGQERGNDRQYSERRAFRRSFGMYSGPGQFWSVSPVDTTGCLSPFITFFLFILLLGQFGLLAAIGFFVFYILGAIIGSLRMTRLLIAGLPLNPWPWRVGNWVISFLLTVWLAGGFD